MEASCGMDYVRAAFKRDFADRIPVTVSMGNFQANLAGVSLKEFLTDANKMGETTLHAYDMVRPDTIVAHIDLNLETEAMGNELEFAAASKAAVDAIGLVQDYPLSVERMINDEVRGTLIRGSTPDELVAANVNANAQTPSDRLPRKYSLRKVLDCSMRCESHARTITPKM